jgi:hypothetical protein
LGSLRVTQGLLSLLSMMRPMVPTMPNKEEALLRILRTLQGQRVEEVADRILALFNAPPALETGRPSRSL